MLRRRYDVHGLKLSLATNDLFVDERFSTLYGAFATDVPPAETFRISRSRNGQQLRWEVFNGSAGIRGYRSARRALEALETQICRRVLELRTDCISLHAGTVVTERGTGALIVGPSGAGKSTLTVALAAEGWKVGGDDAALLDRRTNLVHPIPRYFHLDARSIELLHGMAASLLAGSPDRFFLTPADFGLDNAPALEIEAIIILSKDAAAAAGWSRIAQAEAAAYLASESGRGVSARPDALRVLVRLASGARCYTLARGDLRENSDRVAALLRS